jgi:peptidyl-tRNA hydrolase, PTH1 family
MYLIVGLGNPGKEYTGSRHNLGYQVVEALSRRLKTAKPVQKYWSLCAAADYKDKQIMLVQPLTYMNRSGRAVIELLRNNPVNLAELMIVYDDLDLPPGTIRLRRKGGSAGHRGIQSIIEALGTTEFPRLRIGIGKPPGEIEGGDYVLQPVDPADSALIDEVITRAVEAIILFIEEGLETAMNTYNQASPSGD